MGVNDDGSTVNDDETNYDADDTNDDDTGQDGDDAGQGDDDQKGDQTTDDKDDKKDDDDKSQADGKDDEPPVRKTKADFIKERLAKKAASQAEKAKKDDAADDDDGDVAPEDEDLIDKVIQKRYGHVFKSIEEKEEAQADREEANQFFAESPEFKPFEAKILKWWGDPSRRHLPISTVALEAVGYKNLIKLGAQKEREAADKSKQTKVTGNQQKAAGGQKSVSDMTFEEIRAMNQQVISKRAE